eukprot:4517392-Prymnesium_polylepis.1
MTGTVTESHCTGHAEHRKRSPAVPARMKQNPLKVTEGSSDPDCQESQHTAGAARSVSRQATASAWRCR